MEIPFTAYPILGRLSMSAESNLQSKSRILDETDNKGKRGKGTRNSPFSLLSEHTKNANAQTSEKIFKAYYVWPRFPSLSMSGSGCSLTCRHCDHKYLSCMKPVTTSAQLIDAAHQLEKEGAVGFLLSGGCAKDGTMLNLPNLLDGIKRVKKETNLIVKLHTGFVSREMAKQLVEAGVDVASMEMVGDAQTIKEIFNLDAAPEHYKETFKNLADAGMRHIVPHVCVGLHYGELRGEFKALEMLKEVCKPSTLVMIVLRPTPGTDLENLKAPDAEAVAAVVKKARELFPGVDISLGCMRPRSGKVGSRISEVGSLLKSDFGGLMSDVENSVVTSHIPLQTSHFIRDDIELAALRAGVTRMEIPSSATLEEARKMGYEIKRVDACCALPSEFEYLANPRYV